MAPAGACHSRNVGHVGNERVRMETRDQICVLTLNRPDKLNAADVAMQRSLVECWQAIQRDESVRAVVLTGAGRAFCAGGDLSLVQALSSGNDELQQELSRIHRDLLSAFLETDLPVIAAVQGAAVGFGAELLALCDIVVMAEGSFLSEPHVKYGLPPSPACRLVWPYLTSVGVAKELLMTGRRVEAGEALQLGLINRITPRGEELHAALRLATDLAALPIGGLAAVKRAFNQPLVEQSGRDDFG
jgi:enoyl-CoA hydratase